MRLNRRDTARPDLRTHDGLAIAGPLPARPGTAAETYESGLSCRDGVWMPAFQPSHDQGRAVSERDAIVASVAYLSADSAQAIEEVLSLVDTAALFPGVVQIAIQA